MLARDLSERIEKSIVQHCESFSRGQKHCDLLRTGCDWEVKIAKGSGLTINQSKVIAGETYIVVNYTESIEVRKIWVLWDARDDLFSPKKSNTNARSLLSTVAAPHIEILFSAAATQKAQLPSLGRAKPAKVTVTTTATAKKKHSA